MDPAVNFPTFQIDSSATEKYGTEVSLRLKKELAFEEEKHLLSSSLFLLIQSTAPNLEMFNNTGGKMLYVYVHHTGPNL
jgi:hypothetical protein